MAKALLISVVFAIIAIPVIASRARSSQRGLRWTIIGILLFNLLYLIAVRYIYPHLQE
jgi:predicted membrane-bound dolichyl-phosphate-mannose-protein mannosyltransferase